MKLPFRFPYMICAALIALLGGFLALKTFSSEEPAYAEDGTPIQTTGDEFFVTIHDQDTTVTAKTGSATIGEVLERLQINIADTDIVEPGLDTVIEGDYNINIYRARPAIVIDGAERHYLMTASFDPRQVAEEAGLTVYDGDVVESEFNSNFLETGAASTYRLLRNGGRTVTVEESIAYPTEIRYDYNMPKNESYLEQAGEDGRKVNIYQVNFENNVEVSRELVSEEISKAPVAEVKVVGARPSISPERAQCAEWVRQAGVSDADLESALELIYHESGCRVDAANPSGAYGIPQALPGNKMAAFGDDWKTNPVTQIRWMSNYVTTRYGGWQQAMTWWWNHHWY